MEGRVEMERSGSLPGEAGDNEGAGSRNIAVIGENRFVLGDCGGDSIPVADCYPQQNPEKIGLNSRWRADFP